MNQYAEFYNAIAEIKRFLFLDLIGPIEDDEVLENVPPLGYYAMGILWAKRLDDSNYGNEPPQNSFFDENDEEIEDYIHTDDDSIASANKYKPSSMGVSVMLPATVKGISARFSFGKYTMSSFEEPPSAEGKKPKNVNHFARKSYALTPTFAVPSHLGTVKCNEYDDFHNNFSIDITLCVRKIMHDGSKLATVSIANAITAPYKTKEQNEGALFQCALHLYCPDGFLPVYQNTTNSNSEEELIIAMHRREVRNYAYGHGCSVNYVESEHITEISSEFMPSEQVLQMKSGIIKAKEILQLIFWRDAERNMACDKLDQFIAEYSVWQSVQSENAKSLDREFRDAANLVLKRIDACISRLRRGVKVLRTNDEAWTAFRLMNEAMLLQRAKTKRLNEKQLVDVEWYPFQLAYILQIVPDITEKESKYRDNVDLLWFPTGGGKTEAYLGVASFVIFYRRLATKPLNDGVTIIMRYTLRLLTIQQFERASALICACEYLRGIHKIPGGEISIGLWIGSGMTPNRIEEAVNILRDLKNNPDRGIFEGNPVQITVCPWCREPIDLDGYSIENSNRLKISCNRNPKCLFHSSLPIYVVDDDIYAVQPTLVLSTIDKFARLAWEERSKSLFGDKNCAPPELIIQDELHLISGPLGSLAGIYEIAVEYLCSQNGRYPKVIASTATVKNAGEQIRNLYNKPMCQFPPSGIRFADSFFAVRASEEDRPARTYVGLCETGGTLADLMIRVYANLIFAKALFIKQGRPEEVIDQFSTIIGYFNALKDLGSAGNIIYDRVYSIIRTLTRIKFKSDAEKVGLTLSDIKKGEHDELTSRKTSKGIKETLATLELPYTEYGSYSYVLASNMLSVGIDINRLGVMTMYNQPKSNAEYIQATSRVGRQNPGIILTMYNASRSRDKSHYEQFGFYHKSFYHYVEATSVTPFSARAIEKALHCVFIIMVRLTESKLCSNNSARNFNANDPCVSKAKSFIIERINKIRPEVASDTEQYIDDIAKLWEEMVQENPDTLFYYKHNQEGACNLLISGEQQSVLDFPATLNSLRNVEPSSNIFIQERDS
jgi:hypothetical protein